MSHTPGPWSVRASTVAREPDYGIAAEGCANVLAEVFSEFRAKGVHLPEEAEANARLMAAAPELLDASERLIEHFSDGLPEHLVEEFEAAITKARGK